MKKRIKRIRDDRKRKKEIRNKVVNREDGFIYADMHSHTIYSDGLNTLNQVKETIDNLGKRENIDEHTDTQPNDAIVENDDMPLTIENNVAPTNEFISSDTMQEVVFNLEDLSQDETVNLKQPNEVYYQMYRDARQKAKVAKELALSSYLEAKNIKNTYMLNEIDSDTSDLEIDDESINSEND